MSPVSKVVVEDSNPHSRDSPSGVVACSATATSMTSLGHQDPGRLRRSTRLAEKARTNELGNRVRWQESPYGESSLRQLVPDANLLSFGPPQQRYPADDTVLATTVETGANVTPFFRYFR